jgi:hypothetical protein
MSTFDGDMAEDRAVQDKDLGKDLAAANLATESVRT